MKTNNKGQSLILFVLLLPVLFLIFLSIYEIGRVALLRHELEDIGYLAIDYGIDKINEENFSDKINEIVLKNKDDIDKMEINIDNDKVYLLLQDTINTKLPLVNKIFKVEVKYVGYMLDGKKIIERDN